jgi:hypothetical protein
VSKMAISWSNRNIDHGSKNVSPTLVCKEARFDIAPQSGKDRAVKMAKKDAIFVEENVRKKKKKM